MPLPDETYPCSPPGKRNWRSFPLAAAIMSGVICLAMTAMNNGLPGLLGAWLQAWPLAFAVALPAAWGVLPGVRTLLARQVDLRRALRLRATSASCGERRGARRASRCTGVGYDRRLYWQG